MPSATIYTNRDASVSSANPTTNAGSESVVTSGNFYIKADNINRAYFGFDVSSIPSSGLAVSSATLTLTVPSSDNIGTAGTHYVDTASAAWAEAGVTWNNQPGSSTNLGTINVDSSQAGTTWTSGNILSTAVQNWVTGAWTNNGLRLYATNEASGAGGGPLFNVRSKETGSVTYLTISYNNAPSDPGAWTLPVASNTYSGTITPAHGTSTDPNSDTITYTNEFWNGAAWVATTGGTSFSFNTTPYANGSGYKFRTRASDPSGAVSAWVESGTFTIQNAQVLTPTGIASAQAFGNPTIGIGSRTIGPALVSVFTSDSFNRANGNLSGSNTDAALGGAAKVWNTLSNTPANNATNLQIVGNVLKKTIAEAANAYFDVPGLTAVRISAKVVALPDAGDTFQMWVRASVPATGGTPSDGIRFSMASDGSLNLQRMVGGGGTTLVGLAAGTFAAGDTVALFADNNFAAVYKNGVIQGVAAHEHTGLAGLTGIIVRFNAPNGVSLAIDDFAVSGLTAGGIASAEAVGSPSLTYYVTLAVTGIATGEAFGVATAYQASLVQPAAIASAEAVGQPTIVIGSITVKPETFYGAGGELFFDVEDGSTARFNNSNISMAIENAIVFRGTKSLLVTSQAAGDGFVTTTVGNRVAAKPGDRIYVRGRVRARDVVRDVQPGLRFFNAVPAAIDNALGAAVATSLSGWTLVEYTGVAPAGTAWAAPRMNMNAFAAAGEGFYWDDVLIVNLDAQMGAPTLLVSITLLPGGIATAEAMGQPTLQALINLAVTGIASGEAFGNPNLNVSIKLLPVAIASAETFGNTTLQATITVITQAIPSAQAFGLVTLHPGAVYLAVTGITSAEAFGLAYVVPPGIQWIFTETSDVSMLLIEIPEIELIDNAGWIELISEDEHIDLQEN